MKYTILLVTLVGGLTMRTMAGDNQFHPDLSVPKRSTPQEIAPVQKAVNAINSANHQRSNYNTGQNNSYSPQSVHTGRTEAGVAQ